MADPTPPNPTNNGRWIVIAMIALGVVAAAVAYIYWTNYVTVGDGKGQSRAGEFDPDIALKEITQLEDDLAEAKRVGRFNAILDKAKAFVARYPKFAPSYTLLATVYIELQEWPRAYEELQKSLALENNQPMVHHLAGTMQYVMEDYEKAEEHYRAAHLLNPNDPIHEIYLAQVFIRTNRLEQAEIKLLEVLELNHKSHEAYATLCDLYMKRNDSTRALQQIEKALEHAATNERKIVVPYVLKKAAVQRRAEDADGAMQTLTTLLQDSEMFEPVVAKEVAATWGLLEKPEKAAEFYERATAANPTEWQLLAGAVEWAVKAKDLAMAKRHLRALERLDPHLPVIKEWREKVAAAEKL